MRDPPSTAHETTSGHNGVRSDATDSINPHTTESDPCEPPDLSAEFQGEMAALLAFYAARIGATRRSLNRTTADFIILAILNEQTVALRALSDRWRAATERQRTEKSRRTVPGKADPKPA
jgi:hypothetical protein